MTQEELDRYKEILKQVLFAFDEFCCNHDLNYFAACGTAIGAVRHNGFIPWDDDIDVYMLREDYNRLLELRNELSLNTNYKIVNLGDEGYIYPFAKMIDKRTTLIEDKTYPSCIIGANIDIFPLDEAEGSIDEIQKKRDKYMLLYYRHLSTYKRVSIRYIASCIKHATISSLAISLSSISKKRKIRQELIDYEIELSKEKGTKLYMHRADFPLSKELYPKEWFKSYKYVPFEDIKIRINDHIDEYLRKLYGDYMTFPPIEERIPKHIHYYLNLKEGLTESEIQARIRQGEFTVL